MCPVPVFEHGRTRRVVLRRKNEKDNKYIGSGFSYIDFKLVLLLCDNSATVFRSRIISPASYLIFGFLESISNTPWVTIPSMLQYCNAFLSIISWDFLCCRDRNKKIDSRTVNDILQTRLASRVCSIIIMHCINLLLKNFYSPIFLSFYSSNILIQVTFSIRPE